MRIDPVVKGKCLQGSSDLTLLAPVRQGLIDTVDTRTYKSRLKTVMATLGALRTSSREFEPVRPFSDTVERIGVIHSFRLAMIEPGPQLLLAVTFDGAWEPYIEVLWRKVGSLLDVVFVNCDGYVTACHHSLAEYADWVRRAQVTTDFFYAASALTAGDLRYVREAERIQRLKGGTPAGDLEATRLVMQPPEIVARKTALAPPPPGLPPPSVVQGLQALTLLHRLIDLHPPDTADGELLQRAARDLLLEFKPELLPEVVRKAYDAPLCWFKQPLSPTAADRAADALAALVERSESPCAIDFADVQAGIVARRTEPMATATHGALLLLAAGQPGPEGREALVRLLGELATQVTTEAQARSAGPLDVQKTVALTWEGLCRLGLDDATLEAFPQEFREGMEARSSVLGDVHGNHPRRWTLPEYQPRLDGTSPPRPGKDGTPLPPRLTRVQTSMVHVVVQLRTRRTEPPTARSKGDDDHCIVGNPGHPLYGAIRSLLDDHPDIQLLGVEPMWSPAGPQGQAFGGHFDLADGLSQPSLDAPKKCAARWSDQVPPGDLLLGHRSSAGDDGADVPPWMKNGSFLVVRKLRQDVDAFEKLLAQAPAAALDRDGLKAKLIGRTPQEGKPLIARATRVAWQDNDFDYEDDADGRHCPFHAHVRRANPRLKSPGDTSPLHDPRDRALPTPRIVRCGMSYGPRHVPGDRADRGIVFMAFNASIARQFEVLQRWMTGANSSGGYSGQGDPLLGVPVPGEERCFRFEHKGKVRRVTLDDAEQPLVRLQWGLYLFVPSPSGLKKLLAEAARNAVEIPPPRWSAEAGQKIVQQFQALERQIGNGTAALWKAALEDSTDRGATSASVWAAIRERHGGVLRTPHGVLVADAGLACKVLRNADGRYSVRGYDERAKLSLGSIYLGLDGGVKTDYAQQAPAVNGLLMKVTEEQAFDAAFAAACEVLDRVVATQIAAASAVAAAGTAAAAARSDTVAAAATAARVATNPTAPEFTLDLKTLSDGVLAKLCRQWFGLPDGRCFSDGGWRWDWDQERDRNPKHPVLCPGHFTAPSRYMFQPNPGAAASRTGQQAGKVILEAMKRFVSDCRKHAEQPRGEIGRHIFDLHPGTDSDPDPDDLLARTLGGVLMGFLPTTDGNLRQTLGFWLLDRTLWDLQQAFDTEPATDTPYRKALTVIKAPLQRAMQRRPVPEVVWRTAVEPHALGEGRHKVEVEKGDKIVVGIVSATQQRLAEGKVDTGPVFGGMRAEGDVLTHACPARKMAFGVLLGTIAALLDGGPLKAHPVPGFVLLSRAVP